jgi:hypothetical protein
MKLALALIALGGVGVVMFAFLSWRFAGGSAAKPNSFEVAQQAPKHFQWAGRACALVVLIGFFRLFNN